MSGKTFSASWFRVADLRLGLKSSVTIRRQYFRGDKWFVLHDPFNNNFFRIRPESRDFLIRLHPSRTVEEVWLDCLERDPETTPGQEDVIRLLTQLNFANLLFYETPADSAKLFERYTRQRQREIRSKLLSIMFVRLPLVDPDRFLERMMPLLRLLFGPVGAAIWLFVVILAGKLVLERLDVATQEAQQILAPNNLVFLYLGLVIIKSLHELGHAAACKRFGGEVHTMGVMLLVFTPLPYVDATSSWSIKSRWHRALVGAAGMIAEIFLASLAVFVWAYTGSTALQSLAYNMMFIASVSTLLFNANPLLRFDGYYILSDLLDIPNLHARSRLHLRHLAEMYLFGCRDSIGQSRGRRESLWLALFGVLSALYRLVVFGGIILFIADKYLLAGLLMAAFCLITWGLVPLLRFFGYLASSPRLARTRARAVTVTAAIIAVISIGLGLVPAPYSFQASGVVESSRYLQVVNDSPGFVVSILTASGTAVRVGTPLMELVDREIDLAIEEAQGQWEEVLAIEQKAESEFIADLAPLANRKRSIEAKLDDLQERKRSLLVTARQEGVWVAPGLAELVGTWLPRGQNLGMIIDPRSFRFSAVVLQEEASNLFLQHMPQAEVRLHGQAEWTSMVSTMRVIPFQQGTLPSLALGWRGGGDVAVSRSEASGLQAEEPFFQIYAELPRESQACLYHGRSGKLRLTMTPEPLLRQWTRKIQQLVQKRYKV